MSSTNKQDLFVLPASFAQERLWFLDQLEPGDPAFNINAAARLSGKLNISALVRSIEEVIRRHEILRTVFMAIEGRVVQIIGEARALEMPVIRVDPDFDISEAGQFLAGRRFDLAKGPLLWMGLLERREDDHILLVCVHHIVADGWSMAILVREVMVLYEAFQTGAAPCLQALPVQYADFAEWQRRSLTQSVLSSEIGYWKQKLDAITILDLPADYARPAIQGHVGAKARLVLSPELSGKLYAFGKREQVTLFTVLLSGFKILLHRYSGNPDIVVGSPVAGRTRADLEQLIGCFLNTLVLRTNISGELSFVEILRRVHEVTVDAYSHQDIPFEAILQELKADRDLSRTPFFQVFFNMLNHPPIDLRLPGLNVQMIDLPENTSKFDLTLYVREERQTIVLDLVYNVELFSADRMTGMLEQYESLLSQLVADPNLPVAQHSLITTKAREVLPDPCAPLDGSWIGSVPALFRKHCESNPNKLAVIDASTQWTYQELDDYSDRVASRLLDNGIRPQEIVAIYAHRSADLIAALLGVMKTGAAFLLLDPAYPAARLIEYLREASPRGWIQLRAAGTLPSELETAVAECACRCRIALPDAGQQCSAGFSANGSRNRTGITIQQDDLAHISFTSGSSGRPKAVMGRHGSLTHFVPWMQSEFGLDSNDRYSLLSALAHDPLQRDIFTPLTTGATLCIPDSNALTEPQNAAEWIVRTGISVANLTPATGRLILERRTESAPKMSSLRLVFFVGDFLTRADVAALRRAAPNVTCINFYGTTETQRALGFMKVQTEDHPTTSVSTPKEVLPLGRGMKDVQLLVINSARALAGIGETGEIYFRSPHLALGYLNQPQLSAERFISNWFNPDIHDRLYRTGDLGRYLPDGTLEPLGRADQQVNIRGFRIELGEIQAALERHPLVQTSAVILQGDIAEQKRICAYVVVKKNLPEIDSTFREFLRTQLPDYMIPAAITILPELPLTANGKLDRRALPASDSLAPTRTRVPARTPLERQLARIMEEVLRVTNIGIHDNFFALGGHSLLAVRLLAEIEARMGVKIPFQRLFRSPTVAELSISVVQLQSEAVDEALLSGLLTELEALPEYQLQ
jgi:amino acid adenylation domain-containing protein